MIAGRDRFEVGTGAKSAVVAEQNSNTRLWVFIKLPERFCKRLSGFSINGVADLGPIQNDSRNQTVLFDAHRHDSSGFTRCFQF